MSRDTALAAARELRTSLLDHGVRQVSIELQVGRGPAADPWHCRTFVAALSHHIVSSRAGGLTPGLNVVKFGRTGLQGPLANLYGGFDRISRIITMGWANHPGLGGPRTYAGRTVPKDNGRPYLMGTEFEGGLVLADWTDEFREYMGRHNAGVVDYLGVGADGHDEHAGWAPTRKIDRLHYTTASGRDEIRRWADAAAEEDDMPSAEEVAAAVWSHPVKDDLGDDKSRPAWVYQSAASTRAADALEELGGLAAEVRALKEGQAQVLEAIGRLQPAVAGDLQVTGTLHVEP